MPGTRSVEKVVVDKNELIGEGKGVELPLMPVESDSHRGIMQGQIQPALYR